MRRLSAFCSLCSLVVLAFICPPEAQCGPVNDGSEKVDAAISHASGEAAALDARCEELGRQIQAEKQRIARRDPEFDLAEFVKKTGKALEPPFEHDRVTVPVQRRLAGRYVRTRITFIYCNRNVAGIVKYLEKIEDAERGVRVSAIKLVTGGQIEETPVTMAISLSVVTELARMPVDIDEEGDEHAAEDEDLPDEAVDVEVLERMVDARAAEPAALVGENPQPVLDVLREISRICHGGKLPSEAAEEPADAAADMAPLHKPSGPWGVHVAEFEMSVGRVRIEGSATNYAGVNHFRRALEASPLIKEVNLKGSRPVGERTTLKMRLYLEETPQAE